MSSEIFVVVSLTRLIFSMGNLPRCIGRGRCQKKGMGSLPSYGSDGGSTSSPRTCSSSLRTCS